MVVGKIRSAVSHRAIMADGHGTQDVVFHAHPRHHILEPTVRVELTTGGLRNHCSATELRRLEDVMLGVCPASQFYQGGAFRVNFARLFPQRCLRQHGGRHPGDIRDQ